MAKIALTLSSEHLNQVYVDKQTAAQALAMSIHRFHGLFAEVLSQNTVIVSVDNKSAEAWRDKLGAIIGINDVQLSYDVNKHVA